jgi:hypothetical protein
VAVARVRQGPLRPAVGGPVVQRRQGGGVQRDRALGAELAQGDAQPAAGGAVVDDAVEFQVEQLAKPQTHAAQHQQPAAGEPVL